MASMNSIIHTVKGANAKVLADVSNSLDVNGTQPSPKKPAKHTLGPISPGTANRSETAAEQKAAFQAAESKNSGVPTWVWIAGAAAVLYWYTSQ
jgi:hypothetical protein